MAGKELRYQSYSFFLYIYQCPRYLSFSGFFQLEFSYLELCYIHIYVLMYRDMSFFIFNNCLFFDSEDRVQFFFSTWDFAEPNVPSFKQFMNFKKPGAAQMLRWHKVLSRIQHTSLKQVYKYKQMRTKVFVHDNGIVYFYRHAYIHYPDHVISSYFVVFFFSFYRYAYTRRF